MWNHVFYPSNQVMKYVYAHTFRYRFRYRLMTLKTNDINRLNRARLHTDGDATIWVAFKSRVPRSHRGIQS